MFIIYSILFLISIVWFVVIAKQILFWVYLWQLKEYHIGRFLAHFHTEDGRRLVVNKLLALKVILLLGFFFSNIILFFHPIFSNALSLPILLFALYLPISISIYIPISIKFSKDFFQKKIKIPVLTKKTGIILFFCFIILGFIPIFFWNYIQQSKFTFDAPNLNVFCFWLLLIDILSPIIISLIVLAFQPMTVLIRNRVIKKAALKRKEFKDLLVIGITGSYGKTSTKEFLYAILSKKYNVLKTREHQNSEIGISQCILNDLKPEHQIFICEMGAYNRGGIKLLCDIVKPKIGILTGINEQHLATFGTQENIIKAKFELIESLPKDGTAILNADCEKIMKTGQARVLTRLFSVKDKRDVWAEDIEAGKEDVRFKVRAKHGDSANFRVELLGAQSILNVLGAVTCAKELGMKLKESARACEKIKPMPGSGRLIKSKQARLAEDGESRQGFNIIDAAYSANPDSVLAHLDYLKTWKGKKAIVMPCLIELGSASKDVHQRIGAKINENCDLAIITKKECYEIMKNSAMESGMDKDKILFMEDPKKIFEKLKNFNNPEDVVLLESRVPKELIDIFHR